MAGNLGEPFGIAVNGNDVFVSDGDGGKIRRVAPDGRAVIFATGLETPSAIAFSRNDLLVADSGSHSIKKITTDGKVTTIAGADGVAGTADGGADESRFNAPVGLATGKDGRVFVADTYNDRIRVIENGRTSTLAGSSRGFADGPGGQARFDTPTGIAVLGDRLIVADTGNRRIRVVEKDGRTWTLSGSGEGSGLDGLLSEATFVEPTAIAVDGDGQIFVADGNAIRRIGGPIIPLVVTVSAGKRGLRDGNIYAARFNRPSGLTFTRNGDLLVADSENRVVRRLSADNSGSEITPEQVAALSDNPEQFRGLQPGRWPYDPGTAKRDIAGTLGELRGEVTPGNDDIRFHNGLDIAGSYGETARFVRDEKVLRPIAAQNFGTLRELIRMPTLGYIHIRLGRNANNVPFGDPRFQYTTDANGSLIDVRVPRGAHFKAGEPIGTLNAMNHVHLVAGRSGSEMNALDALFLPGIADSRPPTIEKVTFTDENWKPLETKSPNGRIKLTGRARVVVRAYDQVDGNAERRRLGVYQVGFHLLNGDLSPVADRQWTIRFDRLPDAEAVALVYADGSKSGATGETIFNYVATNRVDGDYFKEGFIDPLTLAAGNYIVRVFVADYFGNTSSSDLMFEVEK